MEPSSLHSSSKPIHFTKWKGGYISFHCLVLLPQSRILDRNQHKPEVYSRLIFELGCIAALILGYIMVLLSRFIFHAQYSARSFFHTKLASRLNPTNGFQAVLAVYQESVHTFKGRSEVVLQFFVPNLHLNKCKHVYKLWMKFKLQILY